MGSFMIHAVHRIRIIQVIKSRRMRWAWHVACTGGKCITAVLKTPERRGPLLILGRRWVGSVQMDLKQIGCEDVNWLRIWTGNEFL
jgi:hypothetical protein